jgi:hypothetical protein
VEEMIRLACRKAVDWLGGIFGEKRDRRLKGEWFEG